MTMESLCLELGIPRRHIKETKCPYRFTVLCHKSWLKCLLDKHKLIDFPSHLQLDDWPTSTGTNIGHAWSTVHLCVSVFFFSYVSSTEIPKVLWRNIFSFNLEIFWSRNVYTVFFALCERKSTYFLLKKMKWWFLYLGELYFYYLLAWTNTHQAKKKHYTF